MGVYFFDSSALVKRYLAETGSGWVGQVTSSTLRSACSLDAALARIPHIPRINKVDTRSKKL